MRKFYLTLLFAIASAFAMHAQEEIPNKLDSLYVQWHQELQLVMQRLDYLEEASASHGRTLASQKKTLNAINNTLNLQDQQLSEVAYGVSANVDSISSLSTNLNAKIDTVHVDALHSSEQLENEMKSNGMYGLCVAIALFLSVFAVYAFLKGKINQELSSIAAIHNAQEKLQEESIALDEKLVGLLEKHMAVSSNQPTEKKDKDHSLALKVADEIVRIETNLSRMDPATRGYKQLSASVRRIKDNFAANGYEIVDMLGKPYNEGMKVIADFVPDENLADGAQIITGITKPQINYNGVMIQAAQITVSQNI
jgi:hypothetical protein